MSLFKIDPTLYCEVEALQQRLQQPINADEHKSLEQTLDRLIHTIIAIESEQKSNELLLKQLLSLKEQITTLYGKVDDHWVEGQIHEIDALTSALRLAIDEKNSINIHERAANLKEKIQQLCKNYALARNHRKKVAVAKSILQLAKTHLEAARPGERLSCLHQVALQCLGEEDEAIALYEVAELFFKRAPFATKELAKIPPLIQSRVALHLERLTQEAPGRLHTIQALIATAEEITDGVETQDYLSRDEICDLFSFDMR